MGETLVTVEELIAQSGGPIDVTETYEGWRVLLAELQAKFAARFDLTLDTSTQGLEVAGELGSGVHGQVQCFAGPEIDWMVYSWMADPKNGFANLHITISPGAHVDVPGFGMALACFGERPWGFIDQLPRRDLVTNPDYYFKYFEPLNADWMAQRRDNPQLDWFTSPSAYVRAATSPIAFCYSGPNTDETRKIIADTTIARVDAWLGWWDIAGEVPVEEQEAMSQHTEDIRSIIAELDPANSIAVRLFGQDICDQLVAALGGKNRVLPRAFGPAKA